MAQKRKWVIITLIIAVIAVFVLVDWNVLVHHKVVEVKGPEVEKEIQRSPSPVLKTESREAHEVMTKEVTSTRPPYANMTSNVIRNEVMRFFSTLDGRQYIKAYGLTQGTYKHFQEMLARLKARPPVITGETRDMYTLMHNMAYFYRVLGKKDISMVKDIMEKEHGSIEKVMALFYEWEQRQERESPAEMMLSPEDLYRYACFFISTLSGRAYISRRDTLVGTLVKYYSVLLISKADKNKRNHYGVDIRPVIPMLINEIKAREDLAYRDYYLANLRSIERQYTN